MNGGFVDYDIIYHGCIVAECGMLWLYMVMLVAKHAY